MLGWRREPDCHFWQQVSLFIALGETGPRLFRGLLWIPLAFSEANPQSWRGLWECYCNFLIQNIPGKRLLGMGPEGPSRSAGMNYWDCRAGWFCPLAARGLGTPELNASQHQGSPHHWIKNSSWVEKKDTTSGLGPQRITRGCDLSSQDPSPHASKLKRMD